MTVRMLIIIIPARTISKEVFTAIVLTLEIDIPTRSLPWGLAAERRLVVVCKVVLFIMLVYLITKVPFEVTFVKLFFPVT